MLISTALNLDFKCNVNVDGEYGYTKSERGSENAVKAPKVTQIVLHIKIINALLKIGLMVKVLVEVHQ
jgi:hypothetical protein